MNTEKFYNDEIDIFTIYDEFLLRLHAFINGETLNIPSRALFPLISFNINNFNKLMAVEIDKPLSEALLHLEETKKYDFKQSIEVLKRYNTNKRYFYSFKISSYEYARVLSVMYKDLEKNISSNNKEIKVNFLNTYEEWTKKIDDKKSFRALFELRDELINKKHLFKHLILHGSCSTLDTTNFSDIDFMIMLRDAVIKDPKKLVDARNLVLKSRKYLDLFNKYNHHGFMISTELELDFYRESYLPLPTLENATTFLEGEQIVLRVQKEPFKNKKIKVKKFIKKCNFLMSLRPKNKSQILDKISSCNVMPVLYLALLNKYVYKKDSFKLFKSKLKKEYHQKFSDIQNLWSRWPYHSSSKYRLRKFMFKLINPLQFKFIMNKMKDKKEVREYKEYFNQINTLVEEYRRMAEKLNER